MSGVGLLRCLVAAAALAAVAQGQSTLGSALTGQSGASFPGACPINKLSDVIVTTVATLPESTTGPLTLAYSAASNFPYGQPVSGFSTSPSWTLFLNNTASYFTPPPSGLKFFGECKQNLLTLQATCSFVFDYSTRRLLDLLSKGTPAGGIPLGGTVTFQFCTLALGNSQVSSPTCFESRGGAPKPVIVKISSKQPANTIPPIGFNACYQDVVGSPYKCLAFSIIQSCADSSQIAVGAPITNQPYPGTPASNGAAVSGPVSNINGNANGSPAGPAITNSAGVGAAGTNSAGGMSSLAGGEGSTLASTQTVSAEAQGAQGISAQPTAATTQYTPSQQVYAQGAQVVGQKAKAAKQQNQATLQSQEPQVQQSQQQQGRRKLLK